MTKKLPVDKVRKFDGTVNGDASKHVRAQRDREKELYPLRIDEKTVILVPEKKCNDKYRNDWIKRNKRTIKTL